MEFQYSESGYPEGKKVSDLSASKGPEFRYANLFQVASLKIPYFPIFYSWDKASSPLEGSKLQVTPEYQWNEVSVQIVQDEFRLPREFHSNSLPQQFQKIIKAGGNVDPYGKCRFIRYHGEFTPPGTEDRLTITLGRTNYLDYLRSGECLDKPLPTDHSKTFRDKYASVIRATRDFADWTLTNICGVGIFLITSDDKIIISKHAGNVAVFPHALSYSSSGTMDWNKIAPPFSGDPSSNPEWLRFLNPFAQIERETFEELAHRITPESTRLFGFGIDTQKLFFQFSFFEETSCTSDEIIAKARSARDFFLEMDHLIAIDLDLNTLASIIKAGNWEPAARAALLSLCIREFGLENVERAIDPEFVSKRWKSKMLAEWTKSAALEGEAAVMSTLIPMHKLSKESRKYVSAVMEFMGKDILGKDVVEIGSGIGRITEQLVHVSRRTTCVEFCKSMIERSRARLGNAANQVTYICDFAQNYHPEVKHDVAICSSVLVHNTEETEFQKLVTGIASAANSIFLFEQVDYLQNYHSSIHVRSTSEFIAAFPEFEVVRKKRFSSCCGKIMFLKLQRRSMTGQKHVSIRLSNTVKTQSQISIIGGNTSKVFKKGSAYDVFLSHNSKNKRMVRRLACALKKRGMKVWLDEWELCPGERWIDSLERGICKAKSAAVLVGAIGLGPWEIFEMYACLMEFVRRKLPVIPVLLPGALKAPDLPLFLGQFTWVDLRAGMTKDNLDRLEWGITGRRPRQ